MCQTRNDDETLVEKNKQIDAAIESLHIEVKNYESPMPITIGDAEDCDVYHFKKVGQSWEIKFDTELIKGIKHKVGMDYIKTLIGAKGEIDVLTLQAITNPQCIANKNIVDNDDENDDCVLPSQLYNIVNKNAVLKQYGDELLMLNKQRAKAELENDGLLEIEEIDRKVCLIEEQIDIIKYKKNDDPELEQNRKKVYTAISNALKNIKDMEIDAGYPDTPIYEHLKKNIETGVVCSYNPPKENSPHWLF
jgi:hypothetical protein